MGGWRPRAPRRRTVSIGWSEAAFIGLACAAAIASPAAAAGGRLTEAEVRAFLARQEAAWNRKDLDGYFAGFTPDAVFVEQTRTPKGEPVLYGRSSLAQAKAQSRRYFAKAKFADKSVIDRIAIAPDGASARAISRKSSRVEIGGRLQTLCAISEQTVVASGARMLSRGETSTAVRCRDAR